MRWATSERGETLLNDFVCRLSPDSGGRGEKEQRNS